MKRACDHFVTTFEHTKTGVRHEVHDMFVAHEDNAVNYARGILASNLGYPDRASTVELWKLMRVELERDTGERELIVKVGDSAWAQRTVTR